VSPDRRYPERVPRRSRYSRGPRQSTKTLTAKLIVLAVVGSLLIGGLIAAQMAAGNDPSLGPKATARAKKASTKDPSSRSSTSSSTGSGSSDPYSQSSGSDGYYYGNPYSSGSSGYSSGSSGSSSGSTSSAPPVTSSTS
jgi:cytoskeletal protein RodZ